MADLFDPSSSSSPPQRPPPHTALNFTLESDDISSLLHTLLQNSSQPSTSCAPAHHQQQEAAAPEDRFLFARSVGYQAGMLESHSGLNFRFSGGFYSSGANELAENAFSSSIGLSMEGIGEVECESEDQLEVPANPPPVRSSSKRSRAAEVHNLSEKRRRQRINEKMKALQKLIPNSNKTDKASMLDEAIEYLKQLQLQVQMLTLRNGSGLHPFYLPGISQPVQSPQMGSLLDETSGSKGVGVFPGNQQASVQTMSDLSGKPASSDYRILIPRMSENCNSGPLFVMEPATNAHDRPFNAPMPSKNVKGPCKDPALPQLLLDMNQGQSSSSGVSL